MKDLKKSFRILTFVTASFIIITSCMVAVLVFAHARQFKQDARLARRTLLQSHFKSEYTRLAEDVYLKLDTLQLRRQMLQDSIGDKAELSLVIEPVSATGSASGLNRESHWDEMTRSDEDVLRAPLYFGDRPLGFAVLQVRWMDDTGQAFYYYLGATVAMMVSLALVVLVALRRKVYQPLLTNVLSLQRTAAIAQTTQMLAHDIRRPFSLLKMALQVLPRVKDLSQAKEFIDKLTPELNKAISSVEGMIGDIMEMGSSQSPEREPIALEYLIESALIEVVSIRSQEYEIKFRYDLKHQHLVVGESRKLMRVLNNIIENALQAMKAEGEIWFESRETIGGLLELTIGNTGSEIAAELRERIFDAFFTTGKKGGTGLGLAIAHKIISAHGGTIECFCPRPNTTAFRITLPLAREYSAQTAFLAELPSSNRAIQEALRAAKGQGLGKDSNLESQDLAIIKAALARRFSKSNRLQVLLVDDENFYLKSLLMHLREDEILEEIVEVQLAQSSAEAFASIEARPPDIVICDIDMGQDSLDGFKIVQMMRERGLDAYICMHSNRVLAQDYQAALAAGADAYLMKPMSQTHLLKVLAGSQLDASKGGNMSDLRRALAVS